MKRKIFIPSKINLTELLKTNPPKFKYKKDIFAFILSYFFEKLIFKKIEKDTNYIFVSSKSLQHISNDYKQYLDYLILNNVITTDNNYQVGSKPKGYNVSSTLYSSFGEYYITDTALCKKDAQKQISKFDKSTNLKFLSKWFNSNLRIDYKMAKQANSYIYNLNKSNYTDKSAFLKYAHAELSAEKIHNASFYFHRDDTSFRLHSNLTTLNKYLRNHLTYNNKTIISVDISNAQFFFSTVLFNIDFYRKDAEVLNLFNINKRIYDELNKNKKIKEINYLLENAPDNSDIALFTKQVKEGNFYEYMQKVFNASSKNNCSRDEVKKIMFYILFSSNHPFKHQYDKLKNVFEINFPLTYKLFKLLKMGEHSKLAIILQTIESHFIIDNVCKEIARTYPDLPIFTCHDSIATTIKNEKIIIETMLENANKIFGYIPHYKVESWDNSKTFR